MRLLSTFVAGVAAGVLLVGCTPSSAESPSPEPSPTVTSQTPTPAPSPSTVSPTPSPTEFQSYPADLPTEDPVSAAIIAGWQEYQRVLRELSADPLGFADLTETQHVTTGKKSVDILEQIKGYQEQRIRILGDFRYTQFEIEGPIKGSEGLQEADVSYCVDRSGMRVFDYDGVEQDYSHLTPTYPETATLVEGLDGIWRVSQIRNDQTQTC